MRQSADANAVCCAALLDYFGVLPALDDADEECVLTHARRAPCSEVFLVGSPQLRFCLALVASHHTNAFATAQARRCVQPHRYTYISRHCNRMGGHLHARAKRWTKGVSVEWVSLFVVCLCTSRWHGSYTYLCFQAGCCHIKWSRLLLLGSARCASGQRSLCLDARGVQGCRCTCSAVGALWSPSTTQWCATEAAHWLRPCRDRMSGRCYRSACARQCCNAF